MDQRTKGVETEIKVARNSEKDIKSALKREVKMLNSKIFEAEKRLPDIARQFTAPIDQKLLMAYSILDELEGQVDEVEERVNDIEVANGGSKRKEESEEEDEGDQEEEEVVGEQVEVVQEEVPPTTEDAISESKKSRKSKKKNRKNSRRKARGLLAQMSSGVALGSMEEFKAEIEQRIKDLEYKVRGGVMPRTPGLNDPNRIVVSYDEFEGRKEDGELFEEESNNERVDAARYEIDEIEYKKKLKQNDQVVYELYNKYKFILEELELYKDTLLDRIEEQQPEGEGEGDQEKEKEKELTIAEMTPEQKDYKLYLLAKELKLTKWNETLDGAVHVLKLNNIQNNAHIREQKVTIDKLTNRLDAAEENAKAFREGLKDFKTEMQVKLKNLPKDNELGEVLIKGELNPLNEIVLKLTKFIKDKVVIEISEYEKNKDNKVDPSVNSEAIKDLSHRINNLILEVGDKADRSYTLALEDELKQMINTVKTKTNIKISSMKDLANDDVLTEIFEKLIDGRYNEYEKSIARVHGKMDKIESDLERCFDNYEHLTELKKDIIRNEQKLDRIYGLMGK